MSNLIEFPRCKW